MRFTWQSKMVSGSTVCPDVVLSQWSNCALASRLALRQAALVAGKADSDGIEQAAVDLVDDLQVTGQQPLEPSDRPAFQSFGQQGVVRVGQRSLREVPGLVPVEVCFVEQKAHQLGDGH